MEVKRGFVFWTNLDPTRGAEIKKRRPCVVVGVNPINKVRRTVVVIPLSSAGRKHPPLAVGVKCMGITAIAVADQIRAVDKSRLVEKCDELSHEDMAAVERGLRLVMGL